MRPVAATMLTTTVLLGTTAAAAHATGFVTPSKNIGCEIDASFGARCDIKQRTWHPPHKPSSCHLDYGQGLSVGASGRGRFVCAGDTALGSTTKVGYGKTVVRGRYRCTVTMTYVRCTNTRTDHGFKLSRSRAQRF